MIVKTTSTMHFVKISPTKGVSNSDTHWVPNTDVWISETGLVIVVELAGMRREDLELTVEGNQIRIAGQRVDGSLCNKKSYLVMEINYGPFESIIEVPPGFDITRAKAVYQNGFLRIDIPPIESQVRSIPIKNGE